MNDVLFESFEDAMEQSREYIEVEYDDLEKCCLEQGAIYRNYAEYCAEMRKERDKQQHIVDQTYAKLDLQYRNSGVKMNEGGIKASIIVDPIYIVESNKLLDAEEKYNKINGVISALDQRRSAMNNLVDLISASWFNNPGVPSWERRNKSEQISRMEGVRK